MKAILANLQANGNAQGAMDRCGVVCEKQTHCVGLGGTARQHGVGGLLQGVVASTHITRRGVVCEKQTHHAWLGGTQHGNAAWGRGEGYSLSLSLSLSLVYLVRSFGLGFLAFLTFSNFSNHFTRFSFVFAAKFTNLFKISTQNALKFLKNSI